MKKIPTLFTRDPADLRRLLPVVHPDCGWVLAGEGAATRKYDGTCVLIRARSGMLRGFARREIKPGKSIPPGFEQEDYDPITEKTVGWEPVEQSGFYRWFQEAVEPVLSDLTPGTYELCGPKINGNPERFDRHVLVKHADADRQPWYEDLPTHPAEAYEFLRHELQDSPGFEGVVWHHPDGRMAKIKRKDF